MHLIRTQSGGRAPVLGALAALFALGICLPFATCLAQGAETGDNTGAEEERAAPGTQEAKGTWSFQTERPVKLVIVGGSVAAFYGGNFGDFIEGVCPAVEVKNVARARYGAWAMYKRLQAQVFDNRRVKAAANPDDPRSGSEWWIAVNGGLNSVAMPEQTNWWVHQIIEAAHAKGFQVLALSLTPWGDEGDKRRWWGADGLRYRRFTQKAVDFVLGRLSPDEAFGTYGKDRKPGPWRQGESAEIAVDLYDSALRARDAEAYDAQRVEKAIRPDRRFRKEIEELPEPQRDAAWQKLVQEAAAVPQWFLKEELQAFDHIHPNAEGHRLIAMATCPKLPVTWKCDCSALSTFDPKAK